MKAIEILKTIICIFSVLILAAAGFCMLFHYKPASVMSGSMEPVFHTGSVVIIDQDAEVRMGDAIAFHIGDNYVTHRITGRSANGWITKGDANDTADPWIVKDENVDGRVMFSIPLLGYVLNPVALAGTLSCERQGS